MEPAPYPPNNTEEMKAVICFLGLLEVDRVKPDAKFLDKTPNLDGSVELVDEHQKTAGELKIQIKKIPDGAFQFDCPIELVGYSTRVSSPFVLVCVDVGNKKAYWCHISSVMAGLKPEQKTFTVRFQPVVDEIGVGFPYFERWRELCSDYLKRVSEYPALRRVVDEEIGLNKLTPEDRRLFQQFVDEINVLLDVDVTIVKHEHFANAWKLGASIHQADTDSLYYSIYTILNGENAPLLTHVPKPVAPPRILLEGGREITGLTALSIERGQGAEVAMQWETRTSFDNPTKAARKFIFRHLIRLMQGKRLHVHGRHHSTELLMWFMRDYAHTLGLPVADTYKTADLSYGLNVFLPLWYTLAYPRTVEFFQKHHGELLRQNPLLSFEQIANSARQAVQPTEAEIRNAIASHLRPAPIPARTDTFSFRSLWQAVEFLVAANVEEIHRIDRPMSKHGQWIRDCYTPEDLKHNVVAMLRGAAEDYADFVRGNRFGRLDSPLVSHEAALVFVGDPRKWQESNLGPTVDGFWVENTDRSLPLMTFIDLSEEPTAFHRESKVVVVRGVRRKWTLHLNPVSGHFHEQRRTEAVLYDLLRADLKRRFGELY